MTADEDGLEALLRKRYWAMVRHELEEMASALGWNQEQALEHSDALARLFSRYNSIPAFSTWRTDVLRAELAETEREKPSYSDTVGKAASPGMAQLRAVQILGGERTTDPEWQRLLAWGKANGRRLYEGAGRNRKWNLTEAELTEALR